MVICQQQVNTILKAKVPHIYEFVVVVLYFSHLPDTILKTDILLKFCVTFFVKKFFLTQIFIQIKPYRVLFFSNKVMIIVFICTIKIV